MVDGTSVAEVLAFARSSELLDYDQVGFRFSSVTSYLGQVPLQTLTGFLAKAAQVGPEKAERVKLLREELEHLSFGLKPPEGSVAFEVTAREARLKWHRGGKAVERRISLAEPPELLLQHAEDRDAAHLLAPRIKLNQGADIWWVPFLELLDAGRFVRMQDWSERLSDALESQCYYTFISHRWLDQDHPDPSGAQAALVAWQLLGHFLQALWTGIARGRRVPRKMSAVGHAYVGVTGSELAESILVNLLRPLPEGLFAALAAEAEQFDDVEGDVGVRLARGDLGLQILRSRLAEAPHIRDMLGRFRLWYDYSCMPQHPRTVAEQKRFEILLNRLGGIQALGSTIILLDSIEDYFGRGWCTFESALSHDRLNQPITILSGSRASSLDTSSQHRSFMKLLPSRVNIIWRAILDTEVFGIQSSDSCMSRLGLETGHWEDRDIVYKLLRDMGPPRSVQFDSGEVVTGVFAVPVQAGNVVVATTTGHNYEKQKSPLVSTIDMSESKGLVLLGEKGLPPFESFTHATRKYANTGHIAIIGTCEGEAILYASRAKRHRDLLENALGISLCSLSWTASDVAPVGHFAIGDLTIRAIDSDVWVILSSSSNLEAGYLARFLMKSLWWAGIEYVELAIDRASDNARRHALRHRIQSQPHEQLRALDSNLLTTYKGGLFRAQLIKRLGINPGNA